MTANSKVYDATTGASLSGAASVTPLSGDSVTLGGSAVAAFANKNVGTGKSVSVTGYTISGTDAGNYSLAQPTGLTADITARGLGVTGLTANSKVCDATTGATLSGSASIAPLSGDNVTLGSSAIAAFANKNVGTGKAVSVSGFTISGTDAANYSLAQPSGLTADISARTLNVTGVTANNKVYDATTGATLAGSANIAPLGGDSVTLSGSAIAAFDNKNAGTGKTVIVSGYTISGSDAANYSLLQPGLTATITPRALNVTANSVTKTFDGVPYSGGVGVTYSGFVSGETTAVLGGTLGYGGSSQGAVNPGSYVIAATGLANGNYAIGYVDGTLTIGAPAQPFIPPPVPTGPLSSPSQSPPGSPSSPLSISGPGGGNAPQLPLISWDLPGGGPPIGGSPGGGSPGGGSPGGGSPAGSPGGGSPGGGQPDNEPGP